MLMTANTWTGRFEEVGRYINKQWINKRSVGPERLSVRDNRIVSHSGKLPCCSEVSNASLIPKHVLLSLY